MSNRFIKSYKVLCIMVFALIALGSSVRAMNAGLACPDWPLCFGQYVPDYHPQVYFEFIHRVLAGSVGLLSLALNGKLLFSANLQKRIRTFAGFSFLLLFSQVVLGGLTVLKLLQSSIVTLHLVFGLSFFSCLLWIYFSLKRRKLDFEIPAWLRFGSVALLAVIITQIVLGGFVASTYAGLACQDFPLCNGKLIPTLEGGLGLQVMHRLGAYTTLLAALTLYLVLKAQASRVSRIARVLISLVLVQAALGIANIKFLLPALITVLHTAVAAALVATCLYIVFLAWTNDSRSRVGFQAPL